MTTLLASISCFANSEGVIFKVLADRQLVILLQTVPQEAVDGCGVQPKPTTEPPKRAARRWEAKAEAETAVNATVKAFGIPFMGIACFDWIAGIG